jgi:hypothetical protein
MGVFLLQDFSRRSAAPQDEQEIPGERGGRGAGQGGYYPKAQRQGQSLPEIGSQAAGKVHMCNFLHSAHLNKFSAFDILEQQYDH